jgi:hypothetical protein
LHDQRHDREVDDAEKQAGADDGARQGHELDARPAFRSAHRNVPAPPDWITANVAIVVLAALKNPIEISGRPLANMWCTHTYTPGGSDQQISVKRWERATVVVANAAPSST